MVITICLTCGCGAPNAGHDEPGHITLAILAAAADAAGISILRAAANLRDTLPVPGPLPRLFCDIDGVLAFQPEGDVMSVNARFGTGYLGGDVDWFPFWSRLEPARQKWLRDYWPGMAINLAPDTAAIGVLRRAVRHGYPLTICTERGPALRNVTAAWCQFWKVPGDQLAVVAKGGKEDLLALHGPDDPAILIDDSPVNAGLARAGVQVWQPARPYNSGGDGVFRFGDWAQARTALGMI